MNIKKIIFYIKRLYKNYVRKYLNKIFLALILSILVAGTTSAIAWLLDPAVKKNLYRKQQNICNFYTNCDSACFLNQRNFVVFGEINNSCSWSKSEGTNTK